MRDLSNVRIDAGRGPHSAGVDVTVRGWYAYESGTVGFVGEFWADVGCRAPRPEPKPNKGQVSCEFQKKLLRELALTFHNLTTFRYLVSEGGEAT